MDGARRSAPRPRFDRESRVRRTVPDQTADTFTSFTTGSVRLALYPIELLHAEAAPGEAAIPPGSWNGVTLSVNVSTRDEVDVAIAAAVTAGASAVGTPVEREWGGYTGYFADPEGHRWEIAWAPFFTNFE